MAIYFFAFVLGVFGMFLPITWMSRKHSEGVLSTKTFLAGAIAHALISIVMMLTLPMFSLVYSGFALLLVLLSPLLIRVEDVNSRRQLFNEDVERLERFVEKHPDNLGALTELADAYCGCARYDEGIATFERAIAADPANTGEERRRLRKAQRDREEMLARAAEKGPRGFLNRFLDRWSER
jgi:tetratricopeptide (TPR) repeat protein